MKEDDKFHQFCTSFMSYSLLYCKILNILSMIGTRLIYGWLLGGIMYALVDGAVL